MIGDSLEVLLVIIQIIQDNLNGYEGLEIVVS